MAELAGRGVAMDSAMAVEAAALDALAEAAAHLEAGRLREARRVLAMVVSSVPEHPHARRLGRRVAARETALAEAAAAEEPEPMPPPRQLDLSAAEPAPVLTLQTPPPSRVTQLIVDFQSARPRGALTIYSEERQIFREGFHFTEKTRFLLNRGTEGSFSRTLEHSSGPVNLRLYLTLPGIPTQVVRLQGALRGTASQMLRIRVDEDGGFTARLQ
jgi:hypothetical protein